MSSRLLVVVPEPADWLTRVRADFVVAPWAVPVEVGGSRFLRRRAFRHAKLVSLFPAYTAWEAALQLWARGELSRRFRASFGTRAAVDRAVALALRAGAWRAATAVVAPSLAARRTFAAARARGLACVLIEDLPDLHELARDLDTQAARHPSCPLLAHHRPTRRDIATQAIERVLARAIGVRGRLGWNRTAPVKRFLVPFAPDAATSVRHPETRVVLVAGRALGRSGTMLLPAIARAAPELAFAVQGTRVEPAGLLDVRGIRLATAAERRLEDVAVVLSLAVTESHPPELRAAIRRGIPVVGTAPSMGQVDSPPVADEPHAIATALACALRSPEPPRAWAPRTSRGGIRTCTADCGFRVLRPL